MTIFKKIQYATISILGGIKKIFEYIIDTVFFSRSFKLMPGMANDVFENIDSIIVKQLTKDFTIMAVDNHINNNTELLDEKVAELALKIYNGLGRDFKSYASRLITKDMLIEYIVHRVTMGYAEFLKAKQKNRNTN